MRVGEKKNEEIKIPPAAEQEDLCSISFAH
jgi:hypothetical protein